MSSGANYGDSQFEAGQKLLQPYISAIRSLAEGQGERTSTYFAVDLESEVEVLDARLIHVRRGGMDRDYDPLADPVFGQAAKYLIAWWSTIEAALSDDQFFSIAHVAESEQEVEASIVLASRGFYKQAIQLLRGVIEDLLLPIHFCDKREAFEKWLNGTYRVWIGGRSGLVEQLKAEGLLDVSTATAVRDVYEGSNVAVHGAESVMSLKGVYTGTEEPSGFSKMRHSEWCKMLGQSIECAIRLLAISCRQWAAIRPVGVFCSILSQ